MIIGSGRQTIIWSNTDVLPIAPLGAKVCAIWFNVQLFLFEKINFKISKFGPVTTHVITEMVI